MTGEQQQRLLVRHFLPIVGVFFLVLEVSAASYGGGRKAVGLVGGWKPIEDVKDPHVQELGEFAVSEHNKAEKTELRFQRVVRGETQVVSGSNYRLVIAAEDGGVTNNYEAVVWEKAWSGFRDLTSFKHL